MAGRTIVITGASDGIGAAAARELRRRGENVVVVGRSEAKTEAVAAELDADWFVADFADLSHVRALAKHLLERYPRIDVLANNAGGMANSCYLTDDGYEHTFQVNYLAPFVLTTMLLERLVESRAAVLNTTSSSHRLLGKVTIDRFMTTDRCRPSKAYALTKLALVLFSKELHRRFHSAGLSAVAYHPGYVASNFGPASQSRVIAFMSHSPLAYITPSAEYGSEPLVRFASGRPDVDWESGEYYSRLRIAKSHKQTYDPRFAQELWDRTLGLTVP